MVRMFSLFLITSVFATLSVNAATNLRIECEIQRTDGDVFLVEKQAINFDAQQGHRTLNLRFYDQLVMVSALSSMSSDYRCKYDRVAICMSSTKARACSYSGQMYLFPESYEAVPGDNVALSCQILGDTDQKCRFSKSLNSENSN